MTQAPVYPLTFTPALKDYLWGGRNLETMFGRQLPPGVIAESWEISAHEDGQSVVANGPYAGLTLRQLHERMGIGLIGRRSQWAQERGKFPLLIKLLDAAQVLSVQVHPDDAYALANEGNELGKTEMWVVLHAEPGAAVILGVSQGTTPEKFRQGIEAGDLSPYLHRIPVTKGDVICVPAGSVHAIMAGLIIAEIQQNSNTTYRVYDWNRTQNGVPRPLHIDKAMDVIDFQQVAPALCQPELVCDEGGVRRYRLCRNRYFVTERVNMAAGSQFAGHCDGSTFEIWGVIEGQAAVNELPLPAVRFTLLPAVLGSFTVTAEVDSLLLRAYVEDG